MSLCFQNISHTYEKETALIDINLSAEEGEILCLLGQSGCGKTTLLNLTAGILPLQRGKILLNGDELASSNYHPPPEKRPVGLVFQEGALFPHLTVEQNIAFGLTNKSSRKRIVGELLDQIGLSGYEGRYPHTLSGGQQQRVAVARALAPEPKVLLMDEPFANIDIMLRRHLREEMRTLLKARNCITILVTHDPEEAIETSDSIAIMDKGVIIQHGQADILYEAPVSRIAAMLIGDGVLLKAQRANGVYETAFGHFPDKWFKAHSSVSGSQNCEVLIRPNQIALSEDLSGLLITDVRRTGQSQLATVLSPEGQSLTLHVEKDVNWQVGQKVKLSANSDSLIAF
ncbi:iron(III) transport system ATP-binding protein [Litorimonas taeanensis]|uniref:Iron(III) transport system ATP-binding protein n=1 Tax=Litorimonas taeanensis TaxID=568099 RepID=A0A420WK49_9PROT|nr:ABC transporter ATP-binding protein [Litorimonas taeanensis]RKQ71380.1 iron(III) transport system ATP-binding protein [Litorimonas taeanensis]